MSREITLKTNKKLSSFFSTTQSGCASYWDANSCGVYGRLPKRRSCNRRLLFPPHGRVGHRTDQRSNTTIRIHTTIRHIYTVSEAALPLSLSDRFVYIRGKI